MAAILPERPLARKAGPAVLPEPKDAAHPDGSVAVTDAAQSVPVAAEGSRPTAAETVRAISKAIDACATMAAQ